MLVLSRREHERLILTTEDGLEIVICIVKVKGNRVRIGVQAPKTVSVRRQELLVENKGL
jgi:carbon storage regulator CsrA